jgi:hypothetical protein
MKKEGISGKLDKFNFENPLTSPFANALFFLVDYLMNGSAFGSSLDELIQISFSAQQKTPFCFEKRGL